MFMVNVGKYTSPMDPMGLGKPWKTQRIPGDLSDVSQRITVKREGMELWERLRFLLSFLVGRFGIILGWRMLRMLVEVFCWYKFEAKQLK